MENIFRTTLFIAGAINALPILIAFLPEKIKGSYGIEVPDSNYELLLRHRAILFGIVGGIMIYSAITKKYYDLAVLIGAISMISFVLFFFKIGNINTELRKVMLIDVVGIVILAIGYISFLFIKK